MLIKIRYACLLHTSDMYAFDMYFNNFSRLQIFMGFVAINPPGCGNVPLW